MTQNNVQDMIDALQTGNMSGAQDAFNAALNDKMSDALDAKKIEVAADVYGGAQEVTTDVEPEDMEIDVEDDIEEPEE